MKVDCSPDDGSAVLGSELGMSGSSVLCASGRLFPASEMGENRHRNNNLPSFLRGLIRSEALLRDPAVHLAFQDHLASLQKPSFHEVEGLLVHAPGHGVYAPNTDSSSQFIIRALKQDGRDLAGLRVLDVGCGTGVLGLWAAARGALVEATDISHHAVEAANRNAAANGLSNRFTARCTDLFYGVEGRFDLVLFNAPFFDVDTPDATALADPGSRLLSRFLWDVDKVLLPSGSIFLALSNYSNFQVIERVPQWLWMLVALDWHARYRMARFLLEARAGAPQHGVTLGAQ